MRNFTHRWFFSKLGHSFFEKEQGRPLPSSCTSGKIIPRYVILFMHFPKRSNFQVSLLPTLFFSKSIFFETKLFSLKLSNRRKNYQDTIISVFRTGNTLLYSSEQRVTKINSNQNILSALLVDNFLHFTVPMMFNIGNVSMNKYSEDKTSKQIE